MAPKLCQITINRYKFFIVQNLPNPSHHSNGPAQAGLDYVRPVNKGFKLRFVVGYRYDMRLRRESDGLIDAETDSRQWRITMLVSITMAKHSPIIRQFPYRLPPNGVVPPFGGDNLVAVLCTRVAQVAENKRTLSP
ncbi:MAG: hypothetical protein DRR08_10410 [Candidatus Parabeggiatoa sp. nov. 2]|nr:MAG: hypothetical protein DRR08_10410 [Gammaproteobacteria bacterium]